MSETIKRGDICYYLSAHCYVQKVKVLLVEDDWCIVAFAERRGGLRIRKSRLFFSEEEARKNQRNPTREYQNIAFSKQEKAWMFSVIGKERQ